jgi:hypothetical protein
VAEPVEARERLGIEPVVEPHDRLDGVPVVVDGLTAPAHHARDGGPTAFGGVCPEAQSGGHGRIMANEWQ